MSLFNNLVQAFDKFGRTKSQTQLVESTQATQLLQDVDTMLDESFKMLTAIKSKVPDKEYQSYEHDHNQLFVMVVDAKSDIRGRKNDRVFFASPAERDAFYIRMRKLLALCEVHHTDVLSASRKAYLQASRQVIDSTSAPLTPVSTTQNEAPESEWLSIVSESNPSIDPSEDEVDLSSLSQSGPESSSSSQQFLVHLPQSVLATEEELIAQLPDDNSYYRMLLCVDKKGKRACVIDRKVHSTSVNYDDEEAERRQDEFLRVGHVVMQSTPQQLADHKVVQSYQGPTFITSFISSWSYNSLPL